MRRNFESSQTTTDNTDGNHIVSYYTRTHTVKIAYISNDIFCKINGSGEDVTEHVTTVKKSIPMTGPNRSVGNNGFYSS